MATFKKYTLWCDGCGKARSTDWREEEPTVCPYNALHENIRDIAVLATESTDPMPVKQVDTDDLNPATARSKSMGINFDAPPGVWTKKPVVFPYKVNILNGQGYGGFCDDGDKVEFSIDPTIVGVVEQAEIQGEKVVHVSQEVLGAIQAGFVFPGMWLQFERSPGPVPLGPDSTHPEEDEYEIGSYDLQAGTVTLRTGIATALAQGDFIYLVVKYGEQIELQRNELIDIGGSSSGSASLPADTVFNIWFYNSGITQGRVRFRLNFKYGPNGS